MSDSLDHMPVSSSEFLTPLYDMDPMSVISESYDIQISQITHSISNSVWT